MRFGGSELGDGGRDEDDGIGLPPELSRPSRLRHLDPHIQHQPHRGSTGILTIDAPQPWQVIYATSSYRYGSSSLQRHTNHPQAPLDNIGLILGALTAGGGITGYVRTGSVPSVAAGVTVGTLVRHQLPSAIQIPRPQHLSSLQLTSPQYILGGLRIRNRQPYGVELALLASIILAGSSIPRAIKSQKPLPMGLSVLAAYGLWAFGTAWAKGRPN